MHGYFPLFPGAHAVTPRFVGFSLVVVLQAAVAQDLSTTL